MCRWLGSTGEAAQPGYGRTDKPLEITVSDAKLGRAPQTGSRRNQQARRTAKSLFAQIGADGYAGSDSRVADCPNHTHRKRFVATANAARVHAARMASDGPMLPRLAPSLKTARSAVTSGASGSISTACCSQSGAESMAK